MNAVGKKALKASGELSFGTDGLCLKSVLGENETGQRGKCALRQAAENANKMQRPPQANPVLYNRILGPIV